MPTSFADDVHGIFEIATARVFLLIPISNVKL